MNRETENRFGSRVRREGYLLRTIIIALILGSLVTGCNDPDKQKMKYHRKGLIYSQRGRCAEAIAEFQKALSIDSDMADSHYEAGKCYQKLGNHAQAIRALDKARLLNPQLNVKALLQIADVYVNMGSPTLAEQAAYDALAAHPKDIEAAMFLGKLKWKEEKIDEARSWFEECAATDPKHVESRLMLAEIAMRDNQPENAEAHLKEIISEIDPTNVPAKLALAKIYRFGGREGQAVELLRHILDDNPNNVVARSALAEAYFSIGQLKDARTEIEAALKGSPASAELHSLLGAILLKQGDYALAVQHLTKAAGVPSASARTHYLLGLALRETKQPAQAITAFRKAIALSPDDIPAHLMLAQTLLAEGSLEQALREIDLVLSRDPENNSAQQLRVQAHALRQALENIESLLAAEGLSKADVEKVKTALKAFQTEDLQTVKTICQDLLQSAPNSPVPFNLRGLVFLKEKDLASALKDFRQACERDPEFVASYINIANVSMAIGSYEQALQNHRKAMELSPKDGTIPFRYVRTLTTAGHYDEAEQFLKDLTRKNPSHLPYRLALANVFITRNKYSSAHQELEQILKLDPNQRDALYLLAETFAKEDNLGAAAAKFELLAESRPLSGLAGVKLALCELALGQPEKAKSNLPCSLSDENITPLGRAVCSLLMQNEERYEDAEKLLLSLPSDEMDDTPYSLMLANVRADRQTQGPPATLDSKGSRFSEVFVKSYEGLLKSKQLSPSDWYELNLGIALAEAGWQRPAISRFEHVLEKTQPNTALMEIVGRLWEKEGEPNKAIAMYQSAIAADSSYWPAYYRLAVQSFRAGETAHAEESFRSALKYQPNSLFILLGLARLYESTGNDAQALKIYRAIDELHPNLAPVMNNLAWILAKNPETLEQAVTYAQSAATAQPLKADFLDTLGWTYFLKGDYTNARENLDKAVLLDSSNPTIRHHRGMVYLRLGDKKNALADFRDAGATKAPFPERQLNDEMIRNLS